MSDETKKPTSAEIQKMIQDFADAAEKVEIAESNYRSKAVEIAKAFKIERYPDPKQYPRHLKNFVRNLLRDKLYESIREDE